MKAIDHRHTFYEPATFMLGSIKTIVFVSLLLMTPFEVFAAPEEIQVYLDDLRPPNQLGVDVHTNFVSSGRSTSDYVGEVPPAKLYRVTPEFAFGLSPTTELGLYFLSTRGDD